MAISAGNWASVTDPFILALAHSWSGVTTGASSITLQNSSGFINGISEDQDVQEIFFSKDADKLSQFHATAVETEVFSFLDYLNEWPLLEENISGSYNPLATHDIVQPDTKDCLIAHNGKTTGGTTYSLFAYSAFCWQGKDPAQVLFSWLSHHVPSPIVLKDYLNQTSFQDASDYYDENPAPLIVIRKVGVSIAEQIKTVIENTPDYLVIRPAASGGYMQLEVIPRRSGLSDRPSVIDLTGKSVASYLNRPTDRYTLDEIVCRYGNSIKQTVVPLSAGDLQDGQPQNYAGDTINSVRQKVGSDADLRSVSVDVPYQVKRADVLNHIDIAFWKDDQAEIEVDFADWSHLNFDSGDIVHFSGIGYDGTESFLCTEKTVDINTMLASARFLQLHGLAGKSPRYADNIFLTLSLRPNSIGDNFDGVTAFPATVMERDRPRSIDRWWDESGNYFNAVEHIRGTPPAPLKMALDVRKRWPTILSNTFDGMEFVDDNNSGYNKIGTSGTKNYTFYYAGNITGDYAAASAYLLDCNGASDIIFSVSSGGGAFNTYQFYDGLWRGTQAFAAGWQILVFVLKTTGSKIRKNGADIETGLSYVARQIDNTGTFGLTADSGGTFAGTRGDHAEFHLFQTAHSDATIELIEAHLAEKYDITI